MPTTSLIPEQLKKHRKKQGWGQDDLARESGISQSVISKMERGQSLTLDNLVAVANALNIGLDDLMGDEKPYMMVQEDQAVYGKSDQVRHLKEMNELMKESIKRLDREIITYRTHIDRQEKLIDMLQSELEQFKSTS